MTRLSVGGLRVLESVDLDIRNLTVLIGENGSGKSSVLEALEILRRTRGPEFLSELNAIHGGVRALARSATGPVRIAGTFESSDSAPVRIEYSVELGDRGIERERAVAVAIRRARGPRTASRSDRTAGAEGCSDGTESGAGTAAGAGSGDGTGSGTQLPRPGSPLVLFEREGPELKVNDGGRGRRAGAVAPLSMTRTALSAVGFPAGHPLIADLQAAVASIEVHLPLDVLASWAARSHARPAGPRGAVLISAAPRVERLGGNLANVFHALRNRGDREWAETMSWVRLGLGPHVESVTAEPDAAGGSVALWLKHAGVERKVPPASLSDGQLQFLGIVALCRLAAPASVVAFDEPEAHLHPGLQVRAIQMLARLSESAPVLLATHSRRILDAVPSPADAVRVLRVSGRAPATSVLTLDAEALARWLEEYEGLGRVLEEGLGDLVVREVPEAGDDS